LKNVKLNNTLQNVIGIVSIDKATRLNTPPPVYASLIYNLLSRSSGQTKNVIIPALPSTS